MRDHKEHGTRRQLVGQAELLPVVLSQELWAPWLRGRRALLFVDNDAARHAIIRGASPSGPSAVLVEQFWSAEAELDAFSWIEQVPSPSNPADGPSRLRFGDPALRGARVRDSAEVLSLGCVRRVALGR